jgi:hypothetical protein
MKDKVYLQRLPMTTCYKTIPFNLA